MIFILGWQRMVIGLNIRLDMELGVFKEVEISDSFKGSEMYCIGQFDIIIFGYMILIVVVIV